MQKGREKAEKGKGKEKKEGNSEIEEYTKYEIARILGARALQLSMNAPRLLQIEKSKLEEIRYDPLKIAELEFKSGVLPITVKRPMPKKVGVEEKKEEKEEKAEAEEKIKEEEKAGEEKKKAKEALEAETPEEGGILEETEEHEAVDIGEEAERTEGIGVAEEETE